MKKGRRPDLLVVCRTVRGYEPEFQVRAVRVELLPQFNFAIRENGSNFLSTFPIWLSNTSTTSLLLRSKPTLS